MDYIKDNIVIEQTEAEKSMLQKGIGNLQKEYLEVLFQINPILVKAVNADLAYRGAVIQECMPIMTEFGNILPKLLAVLGYEQYIESSENLIKLCDQDHAQLADPAVVIECFNEILEISNHILNEKAGNQKTCICCGEKVYYKPLSYYYEKEKARYGCETHISECLNKKEYTCPCCTASDRDRLIVNFLKICGLEDKSCSEKLLQIAPSAAIEHWINANCPAITYHSTDLYMKNVTFKSDIQDMKEVEDERYDYFICSHILEHVRDDKAAMRELYRILKQNGIGIFLVPVALDIEDIDEAWGLTEEENWKRFGQGDHCRRYERNKLIQRLEEAGFYVQTLGKDFFGEQVFDDAGLSDTSTLYILTKREEKIEHFIEKRRYERNKRVKEEPLVSVIMSAYNHEEYVQRAIESVLNQSYQNFEFLIADDCSTDGTLEKILQYEDKIDQIHLFDVNEGGRLRFLREQAKGKYIAVINSDDEWDAMKLEQQVIYLENHPECAACFTGCKCIDDNGNEMEGILFEMENKTKEEWFLHFYQSGNCLPHPSVLIRREIYISLGGQKTIIFRQLPDFMMWISLVQKYEIHIIEKQLTVFRFHEKAGNRNVSARTRENGCRHLVEETYIWYQVLRQLDGDYFLKVFEDMLIDKTAQNEYEIMCEKFFVFSKVRFKYSKQAAIFYLYDIYQIPEVAQVFETNYGFTRKDVYRVVVEMASMEL